MGALTPNKPVMKATTPNPGMVNNGGSPPGEPLGNRIIAANRINTTAKLIREALSTGFTTVDTDHIGY